MPKEVFRAPLDVYRATAKPVTPPTVAVPPATIFPEPSNAIELIESLVPGDVVLYPLVAKLVSMAPFGVYLASVNLGTPPIVEFPPTIIRPELSIAID